MRCETGCVFHRSLGHRVARFRQINKAQSNLHRDALELPDCKIVLLTHWCTVQRATVPQLPSSATSKSKLGNGTLRRRVGLQNPTIVRSKSLRPTVSA